MARVNNLSNFLTDVASAIKTKKGSETAIPAANFDTEILALPSQGVYQTKVITINENGQTVITPDSGYDAMDGVQVTTLVPEKQLQTKTYNFTQNTNIQLLPDTGYDGFDTVTLNINVPGSTINNQDKTVTENGTYTADSGYTGLGEVTVNVPSLDTSDATATASDIISPKTAYVNGEKITGNIIPTYEQVSAGTISSHNVDGTMDSSTTIDTIKLNDYLFTVQRNSSNYIISVIKDNKLNKSEIFAMSDLFGTNNFKNISIGFSEYTDSTYVLIVSTCWNNGSGWSHIRSRRIQYNIDTNVFITLGGYATAGGNDYYNDYGVVGRLSKVYANTYILQWSYGSGGQNVSLSYGTYTWTTTGGSATNLAVSNRSSNYTWGVFETGNGHQLSGNTRLWVVNTARNGISVVTTNYPCYISHDCNYMVYNGGLYKITANDNATTMFNSKVLIQSGLPSYTNACFTNSDSYLLLYNSNAVYVLTFDDNGFSTTQTFNSLQYSIWVQFNYDGFLNLNNTTLTEYLYSAGTVLKTLDTNGRLLAYIGGNYPQANNVLTGSKFVDNTGEIRRGTMSNNGALNITPNMTQQSIPTGYVSSGTVNSIDSSSVYSDWLTIAEQITGGFDIPLEYIESNGNTTQVTTDIIVKEVTDSVDLYMSNPTQSYFEYFVSYNNTQLAVANSATLCWIWHQGIQTSFNANVTTTTPYHITIFPGGVKFNGTNKVTWTAPSSETSTSPLKLFPPKDTAAYIRVYECQVIRDNEAIHDLVPVLHKVNGIYTPCFKDLITGSYYYNSLSGTLKYKLKNSDSLLESDLDYILEEKTDKIISGNIKSGVTILGIEGTYDGPGYDPNLVLDSLDAGGAEQYLGGTPITDISNVGGFDVFNANESSILYYVMKTVTVTSNMTGFSMNNIKVLDNGVIQWIPYGSNTVFNTDDYLECTITCTDAYNNTETDVIIIYNSEEEPDDPGPDDPGPDDPGELE